MFRVMHIQEKRTIRVSDHPKYSKEALTLATEDRLIIKLLVLKTFEEAQRKGTIITNWSNLLVRTNQILMFNKTFILSIFKNSKHVL